MRFAAMTLLAAALGVACAVLVACGGGDKNLIPGRDASALKRYADRVSQAVADEDCEAASRDVAAAILRISKLPSSVDPDLRENLLAGFNNLRDRAARECRPATTTTTETTTTDTTPTETTDTTTTETTDTTTTETTDTQTTDTETTDTTPTDSTGGGNDSGGSGGPSGGDQGSGGTDDGTGR